MTDQTTPAAGPPPPADLVRSPLSDGEWHRMHPLTPLLRGGLFLLVIIGVVIANLRDRLVSIFLPWFAPDLADEQLGEWEAAGGDPVSWVFANNLVLVAAGAVLVALVLIVAVFYLSWRFHTFRITDDDVEVRSGVLFRTQRRAPLDRVQGVNLTRPMVARLIGVAKLEVIGAGTDGNVKLEYLATGSAETVRADILRLASGGRLGTSGAAPTGARAGIGATVSRGITGMIEGDEAPAETPQSVVSIPVGRLVVSQLLSPTTAFVALAVIGLVIAMAFDVFWPLFAFVPAVLGVAVFMVRSVVRALRYSISPTPDGVRITFGLLTTVTEILPPGRVHAVEVTQPILWRPFGWWVIRINRLSGRSMAESGTDQFTTVLPVGTSDDVERVLRLLLPQPSEAEWNLVMTQGLEGPQPDDAFENTPSRARWLRPFSWRRNGFHLTGDMLLLRRGVIWRKLSLLPLSRLQSFALHQGPLARGLRVAGARVHVVAGPVYPMLAAIDRDAALRLFEEVSAGAVRAASGDTSHRWAAASGPPASDLGESPDRRSGPSDRSENGVIVRIPGGPVGGEDVREP